MNELEKIKKELIEINNEFQSKFFPNISDEFVPTDKDLMRTNQNIVDEMKFKMEYAKFMHETKYGNKNELEINNLINSFVLSFSESLQEGQ